MNREFVELPSFLSDWKQLGLDDGMLRKLEMELLSNPKAGDVIEGTGGVRKLRFAFPGQGKRGSVRAIYVDFTVVEKIYLLAAYAKGVQENLTKAERNELKSLVVVLENQIKRRV